MKPAKSMRLSLAGSATRNACIFTTSFIDRFRRASASPIARSTETVWVLVSPNAAMLLRGACADAVRIGIAEIAADVVDHGRHLIVVELAAEGRHRLLSVDDEEHRIAGRLQFGIARQRRIGAGPGRATPVGHVAAGADVAI